MNSRVQNLRRSALFALRMRVFRCMPLALGWMLLTLEPLAEDWNFRTQILPVLTKAGCNAGACHGAASGQGGFRLSLLGYDPEEDHWNVTRELAARRIDLDEPSKSLILRKPSRELDHEGGRKLPRGSANYETVLRWIQAGAPFGKPDLRVTSIEVHPADILLPETGSEIQLEVTAFLSNGSTQNVTRLALFSSNDDAVAEVTSAGRVTTMAPGLTSIMVRYGGQVTAARIAVPFTNSASRAFAAHNFIDEEIGAELARLGLEASALSTDAEFLRRVYLDLTGLVPGAERAREWLSVPRSQHDREKLISELLCSDEFVDFWTLKFADLLLMSGKRGSENATLTYHHWLRSAIDENLPWNQVARTLLTATGEVNTVGPANFATLASDPRDLAEYASDIMLGIQIACARCHAHPTDRWTRDDYYQFSAFFATITRDGGEISRNPHARIEHPKTRNPVQPKLLGEGEAETLDELAEWMTSPENPFFAKALVNRVWKHLLGRGLVEPVNDLRPTNPATHPQLLNRLAREFANHGFDLRWLIRTIVSSRTYQLSARPPASHINTDGFYTHAYVKPLPAQVVIDIISQVTGVDHVFEDAPVGTRAAQLIGVQTPSYALDVLGRCIRERACEPGGSGGGLAEALHLINGDTINAKLSKAVKPLLRKSDREIIAEFYLRALARQPSSAEVDFWEESFGDGPDRSEAIEDFLWTLLNSREFIYNH